ncbi:ABC transporter permease [Priestia megaterium]|uniref:Transport permease protein n=1 Tax=Priestia megaterium (strain ATCC 14581 / DSM 32 / CCUG 1817 / JCM 2506 / NBRC 15308 / NCIMB 9376 / NCTC 10342 / NRRL B-14308 / VKM B-512 / Ford 19) TaxID=1348623 RepID=A0A0B6A880_PRIM2|nr:ABC transporter permease [Priestia megaterium]AJI21140.1 ABC-2 type transporter family protein [Priestia megaterium NBRC 15308 = ATCC 14581]KFM98032.1 ABC-2 type transporter family protein [Priestia megaterium]KGJ84414.1 Teichoic acid translocation permease TagG [Priestia megaterium NBRC 15308 = ATCC 14581]MCU7745554.1 ABC transporter permease [Priestia megaterium]MDR4233418.1 ABC transporter permease [Priestia megaterium]
MNFIGRILQEQSSNLHLIFRLALYDIKSKYQMHYLGAVWQFLNPAIQVLLYWLVFGLGIRGGQPIDDVPFFAWLIVGLIPWFFISPVIIQGANSVYTKVNLVSKMKFPVSVLPTITIISNGLQFIVMLLVLGVIFLVYGINPGIYIVQLPYYIFSLLVFLFAFTLLFSTISTIIRDFQLVLQSVMRMMLYLLPVLWDTSKLPHLFQTILKLNPLYYILEGFRYTLLEHVWFYEDWIYTLYFWSITLLILLIGSFIHIKFRDKFIDYL